MDGSFEEMWESNRDHLRRVLLALASDVDLAEDLLQETYLRARTGVPGYRGGGDRAWLTAIARNSFCSHARRKNYSSEESLDRVAEWPDPSSQVDSDGRLTLLTVRDAMATLDPALRAALIMKHYGGCDYEEIAAHLSCTPTMAKHRVWRAMQKVRAAVGAVEEADTHCSELRGARILDWLYGSLSPQEADRIKSHTTLCASCRRSLAQIRRVSTVLDKCEGERRVMTLIDLDEQGCTTRYVWVKVLNETDEPMRAFHWHRRRGWTIECLALQGEPVDVRWLEGEQMPGLQRFEGDLPTPVPPGGVADAMFIACPPRGSHWEARPTGAGAWHYHHKHSPFPNHGGLFMVTIRLPKGARLLRANPEPQRLTARTDRISLTWRVMTEVMRPDWHKGLEWQFEAHLDYSLTPPQ